MYPSQFHALAPHYDELMQIVPYDAWADYVFLLFQIAEHTPRKLLDCACGTGNLSFEMASPRLSVCGVDVAPEMLEVARRKAANFDFPIRFFEADLSDFDLGEIFDSATCLYDSLNYILEPEKLEAAFACIARHLQSGGIFVFDMNSVFALTADLFSQSSFDPQKTLHYKWQAHHDMASRVTTVDMQFQLRRGEEVETFRETHRERAYDRTEIEAMLARTGWNLLRVYDAYTINLPHERSERWFFVAQKM